MTLMTKFLGAAATLALSAGAALAEPALIFDLGGKFDKSFNEAAFGGATRWAEETGGEFREIELSERRLSLQDTISRLDIRAPVGGIVYGLQVFGAQSVVQAAQPLMYIVPQDQPLVVSARVDTINIDEVYAGQEASLQFSAFDQREIPELKGAVRSLSADVLRDEATGEAYYSVEIVPDSSEITKLQGQTLLPGMPVQSFIQTGARSPLTYLIEPMASFFHRAFRE